MKRIVIIVVCLTLAVMFAGCGKKSETDQAKAKGESIMEKAGDAADDAKAEADKAADKVDEEAKKATKALDKLK